MAKKKRKSYEKDPLMKIQRGEEWRTNINIDNDNAVNILNEVEERGMKGMKVYSLIINERIRKSYTKK